MQSQTMYQSLDSGRDEIRLLSINPGPRGSSLFCRLETVSLSSKHQYEALSYQWGSPSNPKVIQINGTPFNIGTNLSSALQHLRCESSPRILWIDAICINHDDMEECQNQVRKMGKIYSMASRVVAWIGEETPESNMAFNFIESLPAPPQTPAQGYAALTKQVAGIRNEITERLRTDHSSVAAANALFTDILDREYWSRAWIIQEVALGAEVIVQCGDAHISWHAIQTATFHLHNCLAQLRIDRSTTSGRASSMTALNAIRQLRNLGIQIPIGDLLAANRTAKATKNVDFVFGLLGLARDSDHSLLAPDYTRTETDVFTSVVEHHATVHKNLDLICMSLGFVPTSPTPMASWVPDWPNLWEARRRLTPAERRPLASVVARYNSGESLGRAYSPYQTPESIRSVDLLPIIGDWNAALGTLAMAQVARNPDILLARGVCVDTVEVLGAIHRGFPPDGDSSDWDRLMLSKFGLCREDNYGLRNTSLLDVPLRVESIRAGQYRRRQRSNLENSIRSAGLGLGVRLWHMGSRASRETENRYIDGSSLLQAYVTTIFIGRLIDSSRFDTEDYTAFWTGQFPGYSEAEESLRFFLIAESLKMCPLNRRLAVSKRGYLGASTANAEEGDAICVLHGCSVPVVLRKVDDHHVFVGDCYVHGLMDGQAIMQVREGKLFEEDFCIY